MELPGCLLAAKVHEQDHLVSSRMAGDTYHPLFPGASAAQASQVIPGALGKWSGHLAGLEAKSMKLLRTATQLSHRDP
jgi:hypothetical protein